MLKKNTGWFLLVEFGKISQKGDQKITNKLACRKIYTSKNESMARI
jgi:hypothetical protein